MGNRIIKANVKGVKQLKKAFAEQPEKAREGSIDALEIISKLIMNRASLKIIKGAKTGKIYSRGSVKHQASAPGESPASDTGKLVNSGEAKVDKRSKHRIWGLVGFSAFYARFLEIGTRFMAPRPFLLPTIDELRDKIVEIFIQSLRARLKKK